MLMGGAGLLDHALGGSGGAGGGFVGRSAVSFGCGRPKRRVMSRSSAGWAVTEAVK
jgi:hypothetical protein